MECMIDMSLCTYAFPDDVLIWNYFSESRAEDLWRVVSSYSEKDIAAYYADTTVAASGIQKYAWESPMLTETRKLDFNVDTHKILETELKILCKYFL